MNALLRAETTRWVNRRGLWVGAAAALALAALLTLTMALAARPPAGADVERGRQEFRTQLALWEADHEQWYADCRASVPIADEEIDCEGILVPPLEEHFVPQPLLWADGLPAASFTAAGLGAVLALVLAASFWGAEYAHGTLATWLTFVPDRARVWAAKYVVAVVAGVLLTAVLQVVLVGGVAVAVVALQGPSAAGPWAEALGIAGRGVAFGGLAAVAGASLAVGFRSTVAAASLPLAYFLLGSFLGLLHLVPGFEHAVAWLPETNIRAFLEDGTTYLAPVRQVGSAGLELEYVERSVGFGQGLAYLLAVAGALAAWSFTVFRRRDLD